MRISSLQATRCLADPLTLRHLDTRMVKSEGTAPARVIGPTTATDPPDRTVPLVQPEAHRREKEAAPHLPEAILMFPADHLAAARVAVIVAVASPTGIDERDRERRRAGAAIAAGAGLAAPSGEAHPDVARCAATALRAMDRHAETAMTGTTGDRRVATLTETETSGEWYSRPDGLAALTVFFADVAPALPSEIG